MDDPLVFFKVVYMNNGIPESMTNIAPITYKVGEWNLEDGAS